MKPIFAVLAAVSLFALVPPRARAADLPASLKPSGSASSVFALENHEYAKVYRDAGLGLGVGGFTGLLFSLMSHEGTGNNLTVNDAMLTGLTAGLVGGLVAGLWEYERDKALARETSDPSP